MKQQRLGLCPLSLVVFCALAFQLPSRVLRAAEMPIPSATPAATAALLTSTPPEVPSAPPVENEETWPELHPAVRAVGVHSPEGDKPRNVVYAQRGDIIWVDVHNFDRWVKSLPSEKRPQNHGVRDLILYLDHFPLEGIQPAYWYHNRDEWTPKGGDGKWPSVKYEVITVGFPLVRNEDSKEGWLHVLNQPVFKRKVIVSVGFSNGVEIDPVLSTDQQFFLTIIPHMHTAVGLIVILGALIAFLALARHTHIIRDAVAPRRPDGQRPYSLARGQMAFWFFLVIASYFFLWIVTGDMDTLNTSVLALIGISAGTALGSAFVDAAKPVPAGPSGNQPIVDVTRPHLEVLAELKQLRADTQKELEALQRARTLISPSDKHALDDNEQQQNEVRERLANYRWQSAYFAWPTWKGVMYDLLAENNLISFHRFQIFVWTLILGIMFVASVYNELAMPQFSATLLGLLGISAGTYVGFKLPEARAQ
jgi:hypothetical protein